MSCLCFELDTLLLVLIFKIYDKHLHEVLLSLNSMFIYNETMPISTVCQQEYYGAAGENF